MTGSPDMLARALDRPVPSGPVARLLDPDTSHQAGRQATADPARLTGSQRQVLVALANAYHRGEPGLTDFEHAAQQTSAGKRRKELERAGLVAKTEHRKPSPTGSNAIVWTITDSGLYAARGFPLGSVA